MKYRAVPPVKKNNCEGCCFNIRYGDCSRVDAYRYRCCSPEGVHLNIYVISNPKLNPNIKIL